MSEHDELVEETDDANRDAGASARRVLEYLAKAIVEDADAVVIEPEDGRRGLTLRLHVAPGDMGRIIGRRGRVVQAVRQVVRAAGAREGIQTQVDVVD